MMEKVRMQRSDWSHLILTEQEFQDGLMEETEIRHHEKVYDIASIEKKDGFVYIKCLHDAAEENIFSDLEKFFGKNGKKTRAVLNHLLKYEIPYINSVCLKFRQEQQSENEFAVPASFFVLSGYPWQKDNPPELA
jgi:hypothetical protein